jgi:hypothetical protein
LSTSYMMAPSLPKTHLRSSRYGLLEAIHNRHHSVASDAQQEIL